MTKWIITLSIVLLLGYGMYEYQYYQYHTGQHYVHLKKIVAFDEDKYTQYYCLYHADKADNSLVYRIFGDRFDGKHKKDFYLFLDNI